MPVVVYKKLGKFFNHNRVEIYFVPALRLIKLYKSIYFFLYVSCHDLFAFNFTKIKRKFVLTNNTIN